MVSNQETLSLPRGIKQNHLNEKQNETRKMKLTFSYLHYLKRVNQ